MSEEVKRLQHVQENEQLIYNVYGDSAYTADACLRTAHEVNAAPEAQRELLTKENNVMKAMRESVEWFFKDMKNFWTLVDRKKSLKLKQNQVGKIFIVAAIVHNAYVTMNGNEITAYFETMPPDFEDWVR